MNTEVRKYHTELSPRPDVVDGQTIRVDTSCGGLFIAVTLLEGELFEIFAWMAKAGDCKAAWLEALCRICSAWLRSGNDPEVLIHQLAGVRCPSPRLFGEGITSTSCPDAIAKVLIYFHRGKAALDKLLGKQKETAENSKDLPIASYDRSRICSDCGGSDFIPGGGNCWTCRGCGRSSCEG